jgi:hypothetical protein
MCSRKEIGYLSEVKQLKGWLGGKAFAIGAACTVVFCAATAFGMHVYIPFPEVSHTADVIFVGTVVDTSPRMGPMGNMILTDVTFEEIVLIKKKPGVLGDVSESVILTFAGGQIGDRGISVSGVPTFEVGQRYVVFSLMDGQPYSNPLVGGSQGLFRVEVDALTNQEYPVTPYGSGIISVSEGRLKLTRRLERISDGAPVEASSRLVMMPPPQPSKGQSGSARSRQVSQPDSVLTLEEFIGEIQVILAGPAPGEGVLSHFSGQGETDTSSLQPFEGGPGGRSPKDGMIPMGPEPTGPGSTTVLDEGTRDVELLGTDLCYCGSWELFLVMEQVPEGWTSYAHNEYGMWMWNRFMDIYRFVASDGAVGDNDDNEFAGFMDNATLMEIYEIGWDPGDLGVCITTWMGGDCDVHNLVQADIIFNSAVTWSYDFNVTFNNSAVRLYRPAVIHELGHSWGFQRGTCTEDYSYDMPSVMHRYYFDIVEDGQGIHAGDAWAIRNVYGSETSIISIQDIGVESYYADSGLINSTTDKTNYVVGESITIQNYSVENMSNTATNNVRVRFFLSTDRNITTSDYQMGDWFEWASFWSQRVWVGDTETTIPVVPTGTYWVGAIVTRNGDWYDLDDYTQNNATFWPVQINVTCPSSGTPTGVSASDGTDCSYVQITWYSAANADEYRVYRDDVPIGNWQTDTSYDDPVPDAWEVYSYRVKSRNECGESGLSSPDNGHRAGIPTAPTNVQASDGTSCDYVFVSWTAGRTVEYIVIRDGMAVSSWQEDNNFYDYSGDPGTVYTYQVKARNMCGQSIHSLGDEGHRKGPPPAPQNLQATDGEFCDKVQITWDSVLGATEYGVYREGELLTSWVDGNSYDDTTAIPGRPHLYEVKAKNECGEGEASFANYGYRKSEPRPPVAPDPSDGAIDVSTSTVLKWNGGLYAGNAGFQELHRLDRSSGIAHLIGSSGVYPGGLAWTGTTMYMIGLLDGKLYTLDLNTGVATLVGDTGIYGWQGLAADPNDGGQLYGIVQLTGDLYRIATDATTTLVATGVGYLITGLTFDGSGTLWGVEYNSGEIYTINKTNGNLTLMSTTLDGFQGIDFDEDGLLWGQNTTMYNSLCVIDPASGVVSIVGRTLLPHVRGLSFSSLPGIPSILLEGTAIEQSQFLDLEIFYEDATTDLAFGPMMDIDGVTHKVRATIDSIFVQSEIAYDPNAAISTSMAQDAGGEEVMATEPERITNVQTAVEMGIVTSSSLNVAVCGADSTGRLDDVQAKLLGTGQFASVSTIDTRSMTPTFWDLQGFNAILVYCNYKHMDRDGLGDVMADYVDFGGRVVCAILDTGDSGDYRMAGRWATDGYLLWDPVGLTSGPATLGAVQEPSHPIMDGVISFDGGSGSFRPTTMDVHSGVVRVADWSDGHPLVAARYLSNGIPRVDLGFHPPSSDVSVNCWDASTDGALLMANALTWVAQGGCQTAYDVYFGMTNPPPLIATDQTGTSWSDLGDDWALGTTYYWKIMAKNCCGQTEGDTWSFEIYADITCLDFITLVDHWLDSDCAYPNWCGDADFNHDTIVDIIDFTILSANWENCVED